MRWSGSEGRGRARAGIFGHTETRGQECPRYTGIGHTSVVSGMGVAAVLFLIAFRHEN